MNKKLILLLSTVSMISSNTTFAFSFIIPPTPLGQLSLTGSQTGQILSNGTLTVNTTLLFPNYSAILISGNNNVLTNAGQILASSSSSDSFAIRVQSGSNNQVTNTGTITATSTTSSAIAVLGYSDGITVTNTGTISATGTNGSVAIDFTGQGSNLQSSNNILTNSGVITGRVLFGSGSGNVLNMNGSQFIIAEGNYSFGSASANNYSQNIATTELVGASQVTQQNVELISSIVSNQLNSYVNKHRNEHQYYYWAEGLGSYQQKPAVSSSVKTNSLIGVVLVGVDKNYNEKIIVGTYVGGAKGKLKIQSNTDKNVTNTGFVLGGYSSIKLTNDNFLDLNLPLGYSHNKSNRIVYTNLGNNNSSGHFNEYYFAPGITLSKNIEYKNITLIPSVTANYLGQYISSYTETLIPLKVKSRYTNTIGGIGQVALQKIFAKNSETPVQLAMNIGVEATRELGDRKIDISLLNISGKYKQGGPASYVDAIAGLSINRYNLKKGINIFANLQGSKGISNASAHNYKIALDTGIEVRF